MNKIAKWGLFFCIMVIVNTPAFSTDADVVETIRIQIPVGEYSIINSDEGQKISVDGYGYLLIPGRPKLPSKIFTIALPPGAKATSVDYTIEKEQLLPGVFSIMPSPLPRCIGEEDAQVYARDLKMYEDNYESVYGSDNAYPAHIVEMVGKAGYRNYNLVDVRVTPFTYSPQSGELIYNSEIDVTVSYIIPGDNSDVATGSLASTEKLARSLILNYDQAQSWYPVGGIKRGLHDFVIITLESLTSTVQPLVAWETAKGRNVEVVTVSWINTQYSGYDLAEKIRNFLLEKYPAEEWGIEDALIVGHINDIPMRLTDQDWGYGRVKTDLYYADLSSPDSESWDADGDHLWGEDDDDFNDFYSEINVGRIPWSDQVNVENICLKTVAFEQNSDPSFKKNILLLGGYFWNNDPNPVTDNAVLMEAKIDQPWMADWTKTRMYEKNTDCWSSYDCDYPLLNSNVRSVWSSGKYCFVNWAGHGSPTSSHIYGIGSPAFISTGDCSYLNDEYPSIIFADACSNANPDYLNIGQAMIRQGAVGFLGATQVAGGMPGWSDPYDGSSQSLDYFFTTYITSGDYTFGEAHQQALRDMYVYGLWGGALKYQMFQWGSIWGNPDIAIARPPIEIQIVDPLPEYMELEIPTILTVRINEITDICTPGTELFHYRYEEGEFLTVPLTSIGEGLYQAELTPPDCKAVPEYYFSVEGQTSGLYHSPFDAPLTTYSARVGVPYIVFTDDFDTDNGWLVENDASLAGGAWERGTPVGGGDRGDPPSDRDGSGQCYLTENADDDSDVDGGPTSLISPGYKLQGIDAEIHYSVWYTNDYGGDPNNDYLYVYLSDDDGANWQLAESIGPQSLVGWNDRSILVSDHITPTDDVKIKFEVDDDGMGSIVEAGIDNFTVMYVECVDFLYGDANSDEDINVADAVFVINYVFNGGPPPEPIDAGDANCDGEPNVADAVYLINYVFSGGPEPGCP